MTALHWAANTGDYGVARRLVAAGANVNMRTSKEASVCDKEQTPLHFAVEFQDVEMVKLFLAAGADVNAKDTFEHTPLHQVFAVPEETYASWWRMHGLCKPDDAALLELKQNRVAIAELLLHAGADRKARFAVEERTKDKKEVMTDDIWLLLLVNENSGGLEVSELLERIKAEPRSLESLCRLAIRKHLARPILRDGNIERLPLPNKLKDYVAMEIL